MYIVQSCKNDAAGFTLCKNFTQTSTTDGSRAVSVLSKVSRVENGDREGGGESFHFTFCFLENTTVINFEFILPIFLEKIVKLLVLQFAYAVQLGKNFVMCAEKKMRNV